MEGSEYTYHTVEFAFFQEQITRTLAQQPHTASEIALQLLQQLQEQRQKHQELAQKYDELLLNYLNLNDAYLATLRVLGNGTK